MASLRKIVIVNTADQGGGAERVSMAVLDGLLQRGVDAWLLVGNKTGQHSRVVSFYESPFFDYRPYAGGEVLAHAERRRKIEHAQGLEDFNHPYSHRIGEMTGSVPDLVLCHNLHGGYFDLRCLPALSARVPVALRLFDTWLQAGHCAYSLGCDRWEIGCGHCPDLAIPPAIARDATRANLSRKRQIFESSRVFVSAESQWMLARAQRSVVAAAAVDWKHIPGGVDRGIFHPGSRRRARRKLGLDPTVSLLLYVANGGSTNPYKDFANVRSALARLSRPVPKEKAITLCVVGSNDPDEQVGDVSVRHVGYVASQTRLADFYRAADVVIHSALEETFGNVVAEAMACGRAVVAASGGGVLELIRDGQTGVLVPPRRPELLADAVAQLLQASGRAGAIGRLAATSARCDLDFQVMVENIHSWCTEIHSAWHARSAAAAA